jgi:hypothetical protein
MSRFQDDKIAQVAEKHAKTNQMLSVFNGKAVKTKMTYPDGLPDAAKKFPSYLVEQIRDQFEIPHEKIDKENCPVLKMVFDIAAKRGMNVCIVESQAQFMAAHMGSAIGTDEKRILVGIAKESDGAHRIFSCKVG